MGKNRQLNRILSVVALLAVVAMVAGIFSSLDNWGGEKPQKSEEPPAINPSESETSGSRMVKLYFRCTDQPYLSCETRKVDIRADERLETAVLRELYKGPSSSRSELEATIAAQTSTVSVADSGDTLIVTVSSEFLQPPKPLPENWAEDLVLREEAMLRRRLAVYSLVDTLTDLGRYASVQILVDLDDSGTGKKLRSASFGFMGDGISETPIEPMSYQSKVVLNPRNTLDLMLRSAIEKDWTSVYRFITQREEFGSVPPYEVASASFGALTAELFKYTIDESTIEATGDKAVVFVNAQYRTQQGETYTRESVPVRMVMENELWKATYESIDRLLRVPQ